MERELRLFFFACCAHFHLRHPPHRQNSSAARHWLAPVRPAPRPYQASIASTALLHNTLVCLPTGLGKTMIASVVMANFARWFPSPAKVVFVAPTRPLVSQQVRACATVMGASLQNGEAVELTGSMATPRERAAAWDDPVVRFVFTTPQAFRNDLSLGVCPAHRVVCVVVDECHRCVGKSDGAVALRTLSEKFGIAARVVGLSATPGSTRAAVQEVLANTNAARIEFRAEGDACLEEFVHKRTFERLVVPPPPPPGPARAAACRALRRSLAAARSSAAAATAAGGGGGGLSGGPALSSSTLALLSTQGLSCDPDTAPRATLAAASKRAERAAKEARAAASTAVGGTFGNDDDGATPLHVVLSRALEAARHLRAASLLAGTRDAIDAYGVRGGADYLAAREADAAAAGLCSSSCGEGSGAAGANGDSNNTEYRALVAATVGSGGDPKLSALLRVLEKHFGSEMKNVKEREKASDDNDSENTAAAAPERGGELLCEDRTRAIVFASLRETVAVIVRSLCAAGYDARPFVGQGTTTAAGLGGSGGGGAGGGSNNGGSGGMRQAEQAATLAAFRAGDFPVLVATCVGEEGLDVPAVDLCVCYDSAASPLRGVQRAGRAGRARPGAVVCLLSAGKEESAAAAAAAATAELHGSLRAQAFELARRAPRMLPREFVPARLDVDLRAGDEEEEEGGVGEDGNNAGPSLAFGATASRRNVLPSSRRALAAAGGKGAWGKKNRTAAAVAVASAPPPPLSPSQRAHRNAADAATEIDGLLFPADTAPVVRLSTSEEQQRQLVVDTPPAALIAAVEAEEAAAEEAEKDEAAAKTPAAAYGLDSELEKIAAAAARLTQVLSVSQRATTGSKGGKRSDNGADKNDDENLDCGGGCGADTDSEFGVAAVGAGGADGWLDAGRWGDDDDVGGAWLEAGSWDLQQSLSSAGGAAAASAERQQQQQQQQQQRLATADRRGGGGGASSSSAAAAAASRRHRVLLDSASPALARMPRRKLLERSSDDPPLGDDSPEEDGAAAAARPRRLLKKRRTSRAGAQAVAAAAQAAAAGGMAWPQQRRARDAAAAAAAAFFDAEAGLSTDDDDDAAAGEEEGDEGEDGSYESSFLDDGTQPEEEGEEVEDGGQGRNRRRRPRRLSDELAAYRAQMVRDANNAARDTPGDNYVNGGMGRRRMRRLLDIIIDGDDNQGGGGGGEEEERQGEAASAGNSDDDYDEDDSFIATARSDGRAPSVAGPSQHNNECSVCGDLGGVSGKGALLCCSGCPTAVHARCISKNGKGERGGDRDWMCAVCSDD